ncbi:hypothetical protein [Jannaschia formosa]|uniref:hypothetical protein n=1 Tax=Jannaschia formosa TaxID=2259592 RepID=UPI0010756899|nr:hypothetical protein [Jannaschia formosa]TFL18664.1 hypothetical protein DR046_09325 [Jannaschia formosa]
MIGLAFGVVMFASALISGWGIGLALLVGWLGASLGVIAIAALMALRLTARRPAAARVEEEALGA